MLTLQEILKVRRMMEQTGGYPAGAYDVSSDRSAYDTPPLFQKSDKDSVKSPSTKMSLDYAIDNGTGDVRIVQMEGSSIRLENNLDDSGNLRLVRK